MTKDIVDIVSLIANGFTALGVIAAAWQIRLTHKQAVTSFEDAFAKEYRELASKLPTKAFLGEPFSEEEHIRHFDEMYHYFDLCNEQAFLRHAGRISDATWKFWLDGISSNMKRPAFARAWNEISTRADGDFEELLNLFPI